MKKFQQTIIFTLFTAIFLCIVVDTAMAVNARVRLLFALGGDSTVDGFGEEQTTNGGIGLAVVFPVTNDVRAITGYSYFRADVEEMTDNTTLTRTNEGSFSAHFIEVGLDYSGIEITPDYNLILGGTVQIPIAGSGTVDTTDVSSGSSTQSSKDSSSVSGGGFLLNVGVGRGRWEALVYYQQTMLDYGIEVQRVGENKEEAVYRSMEYGIGVGYLF